ncbi:MAG: tetratricopeptide repeat protein [Methanomicrobiales archaeon]|nr:tetratricopeptide repeat protein [Methanomicrobiales archaeon]
MQHNKIREKILGSEHPTTVTSLNNLVSFLERQGRHSEAKKIRQRYPK